MFTGIITDVGKVKRVDRGGDVVFTLETAFDVAQVEIGASISCSGACLTVTKKGRDDGGQNWFTVDASHETIRCTNLGDWKEGTKVNLERPLRVGDELGGHIVLGHVDGVGEVKAIRPEGEHLNYSFKVPDELSAFVAPKGSIAVDGVSLTTNKVQGTEFSVNIIPHTQANTTFQDMKPGSRVNLEIDVLARYVARLNENASLKN